MLEPTTADLAAIAAEWPLIAVELEVTDAECRLAGAPDDVLAVRAHRRAVRRLLTAERAVATAQRVPSAVHLSPAPAVAPGRAA